MISVYIVEDNPHLLEDSALFLSSQGFDCQGVTDAPALAALLDKQLPDVVVLDWMLPGEDGLAIAQRLRNDTRFRRLGLIFLTARSTIDDRLAGLEAADAYLVKPVDYRELAAVITSLYRRLADSGVSPAQFQWHLIADKLELHEPGGEIIPLSHREYLLLKTLAQHADTPATAKRIVEAFGENWLVYEKNRLELLLSRLRRKLKPYHDTDANPIRSVRNQGYKLTIPIVIAE